MNVSDESTVNPRWLNDTQLQRIKDQLVQDEGKINRVYFDTADPRNLFFGIGHKIAENDTVNDTMGAKIDDITIDCAFRRDIQVGFLHQCFLSILYYKNNNILKRLSQQMHFSFCIYISKITNIVRV